MTHDNNNIMNAMQNTETHQVVSEDGTASNENNNADITLEERALLDSSFEDEEEQGLHAAELDDRDEDGTLLNEKTSANAQGGGDLDVPGAEADDEQEETGGEDEENNSYSLSDQGD